MLKLTEIHVTPRDLEVLQLLADGHANAEIAERLGIHEHTVKRHLAALSDRAGLHGRMKGKRILLAAAFAELRRVTPILQAA